MQAPARCDYQFPWVRRRRLCVTDGGRRWWPGGCRENGDSGVSRCDNGLVWDSEEQREGTMFYSGSKRRRRARYFEKGRAERKNSRVGNKGILQAARMGMTSRSHPAWPQMLRIPGNIPFDVSRPLPSRMRCGWRSSRGGRRLWDRGEVSSWSAIGQLEDGPRKFRDSPRKQEPLLPQ